jgi:hypothetical protein
MNRGSANGDAFVDWHLTARLSLQVARTAIFILLRVDHVQCHVTPPQHSALYTIIAKFNLFIRLLTLSGGLTSAIAHARTLRQAIRILLYKNLSLCSLRVKLPFKLRSLVTNT